MHAVFRSARQISLVDEHTLVLPSTGGALDSKRKVLPGCMDGADVDHDGQIELVVADACGSVYVFKHVACGNTDEGQVSPLYTFDGLGTISCLAVGCVFNDDLVCIVVLSAEARCTVLRVEDGVLVKVMEVDVNWSVSNCILKDINGDGAVELVLCNSRENGSEVFSEVNAYHLDRLSGLKRICHWTVPEDIVSISPCILPGPKDDEDVPVILVGFSIGGFATLGLDGSFVQNQISTGQDNPRADAKGFSEQRPLEYHDYVVYMNSPTLVLGEIVRSSPSTMEKVPRGDAYKAIMSYGDEDQPEANKGKPLDAVDEEMETGADTPSGAFPTRHKGAFDAGETQAEKGLIAICGLGGLLRLEHMECTAHPPRDTSFQVANELVWQESLSTQLFALNAVDITADGRDEIVSCSWDGLTCIYDSSNNVVRFTFRERVQSFWAGTLSTSPDVNKVIFAYATFDGQIVVYTDVQTAIPKVAAVTLIDVLRRRECLKEVLAALYKNIDPEIRTRLSQNLEKLDANDKQMVYIANLLRHALYSSKPRPDASF